LVSRDTPAEERNPVYLLASDDQRAALDEIQSLMAVVEGHGNFVMDLVGSKVIPTAGRMRALFRKRREQASAVQRALGHVLGLEMKLRQYEVGQQFCDEVYRRGGTAALARLWADPSQMPTLQELREPDRWLLRVA
jgi:putative hydrolase